MVGAGERQHVTYFSQRLTLAAAVCVELHDSALGQLLELSEPQFSSAKSG
jgi:hypothetical protein